MSLIAVILITISAFTHAAWNFIGKKQHPSAAFFLAANAMGLAGLVPVLFIYGSRLPLIPTSVWWLIGLTGLFMLLYFVALAGAYRSGDISLAYPLVRSSPIIIVLTVTFLLGRGNQIGGYCLAGVVLVVAGCYLLPLVRFSEFRLKNYFNICCLLALLAALGTTGYTIIDDEALRILRDLPGWPFSPFDAAILYVILESVSTCVWLGLYVFFNRRERKNLVTMNRKSLGIAVVTGFGIYVTYGIVLVAMAYVDNVSYVAAFRQLSVPLGAVLGIVYLKESRSLPKIAGLVLISAGLVLVGMG